MIKGLRILPPIAIGRFGSAEEPVESYTLADDPDDPLGYRRISPGETLLVNPVSGAIEESRVTDRVEDEAVLGRFFKDRGRIRPVAPFLEVFGLDAEGRLVPLTRSLLAESGDLEIAWRTRVANRKVYRRTGDENDIVRADTGWFSGHERHELKGHCANFVSDAAHIGFGHVQFIAPNDRFPEFRLRFTPPKGLIYGSRPPGGEKDPVVDGREVYDTTRGSWYRYGDDPEEGPILHGPAERKLGYRNETMPLSLYAIEPPAPPWLHGDVAVSRGYLDDASDGFVEVRLSRNGKPVFTAYARICVGPPDVAPDALFVRHLADDLEQALLGPTVLDDHEPTEQTRARALDIVRRAYETVRLMNVTVMNGNDIRGRPASAFDTVPQGHAAETERALRPIVPPETVDTLAILSLHQQVYAALQAGAAPWFEALLRRHDEVADLTDFGRRKMPALMVGADNGLLALTHRQVDTIRRVAGLGPVDPKPAPDEPGMAPPTARNLTAHLHYRAKGNPISSQPVTSVANCCPGLEMDFRAVWRRMFQGIELREYDNLVTGCDLEEMELDPSDLDPKGRDPKVRAALKALEDPRKPSLVGHRLLRVVLPHVNQSVPFTAELRGPAPSDPENQILLTTEENPDGLSPLEWSNALARILDFFERFHVPRSQGRRGQPKRDMARRVRCDFTLEPSPAHQALDRQERSYLSLYLRVRPFFDSGADDIAEDMPGHRDAAGREDRRTAVISAALAEAGELTQGLCSPWQNDYRECSCYYWAAARPDYVNVETSGTGMTSGDNWMQKTRTGQYVPDDYEDPRLIDYDDLFEGWERLLRFQIGGRDAPGEDRDPK